jgi:NDP-sugar pyrophosphorylase family protein
MINIVIPIAGEGSRFLKAGYKKPKPFIDVDGISMIERVLQNLTYPNARYILIGRKDHFEKEAVTVKKN